MTKAQWFAVSSGNGNDGVSRIFPDYYVKTADPWKLAKLAAISTFKKGAGQDWAKRHIEIDGDEEFGISAVFCEPPCEDTPDGEYPEIDDPENAEDGRNWSEFNSAWLIFEIFPENPDTTAHGDRPQFDNLEAAF